MRGFFYFYTVGNDELNQIKYRTLKNFWGYDHFKDGQEEIIDAVISHKDALALLPTGGGKSICYQLPAFIMQGTCLVISPLLALMRDQVTQLQSLGAEAEYLSSELDERQEEEIYSRCKEGLTKILYVSPERLKNSAFIREAEEINISFIAVDEAHCISEWGQDFRPGYEHIHRFRTLFPHLRCLALTATATQDVLDDIIRKLKLQNPFLNRKTFRRENLKIIHSNISDKPNFLFNFLQNNPNSGLVYTRTRQEAEYLNKYLREKGIGTVDFFHAGLTPADKHKKQALWQSGSGHTLISTNAFGMGIDKDNVRFVIHYSPPASIENYYQEIGRAGRDGKMSETILMWSPSELQQLDDIIQRQIPAHQDFKKVVQYLYSVCQIADGDSAEAWFNYDLQRIQKFAKLPPSSVKSIITFLHNQEIVFNKDYKTPSRLALLFKPEELDLLAPKDGYFAELLLRNLPGLHQNSVNFNEYSLTQKIGTDADSFRQRIEEMQNAGLLDYTDGNMASIKFLKPRDDRQLFGYYKNLFYEIQKNKVRKWEEMKFLIRNESVCKMKLILTYFGETNPKNCGHCSVCEGSRRFFRPRNTADEIKERLKHGPASLEQISAGLSHIRKENLLETLILLLDSDEVKMQDFRTYILP